MKAEVLYPPLTLQNYLIKHNSLWLHTHHFRHLRKKNPRAYNEKKRPKITLVSAPQELGNEPVPIIRHNSTEFH